MADEARVRSGVGGAHARVLSEHQELFKHVKRLEVATQGPLGANELWFRRLSHLLDEFIAALRHHFATEEEGGYMSGVFEVAPRLSNKLSALEADHSSLLAAFETARRMAAEAAPPHELVSQIKSAIEQLRRHEAAENRLMVRAYWIDLGGG